MDRVDGFLSQKAQRALSDALVICRAEGSDRETWILRRPGEEELGLGINFGEAKAGVQALLNSIAHGENTIVTHSAGGMRAGWEAFPVVRIERNGKRLYFYAEEGNPVIVEVSSPEQAKDAEAGVKDMMELPPRQVIRLAQASRAVMGILRRRYERLRAADGPALQNHPGIHWSWGAASVMVSPADQIVWMTDGRLKHAVEDRRKPGYVFLELDFGYKDGTSAVHIPDESLRRTVVDLLNDRAKGRVMKEVLTWPVPISTSEKDGVSKPAEAQEHEPKIRITQGQQGFAYWLSRPYLEESKRRALSEVRVLVVPMEGYAKHEGIAFPETTTDVYGVLKGHLEANGSVALCAPDAELHQLELHDDHVRLPTLLVQWVMLPVVTSVIGNFITSLLKKKRSPEKVKVESKIIVDTGGGAKTCEISYSGPADQYEATIRKQIVALETEREMKGGSSEQRS